MGYDLFGRPKAGEGEEPPEVCFSANNTMMRTAALHDVRGRLLPGPR